MMGLSAGTSLGQYDVIAPLGSRDNQWITYTETATEGDVWVATIKQ
jgi:hypothetical protein